MSIDTRSLIKELRELARAPVNDPDLVTTAAVRLASLEFHRDQLIKRLDRLEAEYDCWRDALIEIKVLGDTGGWANQMKVVAEKALTAGGDA